MTEPLAYQNIERLQVLCLLQNDGRLAPNPDKERLCDAVARLASAGTELPVSVIATGDPQVVAPNRLTLLVHGALHAQGWDHVRAAEARRMESHETAVLAGLGVPDPYRRP